MAAENKSEQDRVFGNPENLIVSDTLKDILEMQRAADSDSPLDELDSGNISVRLIWKEGFVSGNLVNVELNASSAEVKLMMRRFGSLIAFNKSIDSEVEIEIKDGMYEEKIVGKISKVSILKDKDVPEDKVILSFLILLE
jgi:hypothetical protein|tara:strand:- start:247 stop:666 length:420 start_codon:yes stop_codon:yes gene_type:complete